MLKKIEYNTFDVVLKDLVLFFSSVLCVLLLSTYTLASEFDIKEIITEGRAVIINEDKISGIFTIQIKRVQQNKTASLD